MKKLLCELVVFCILVSLTQVADAESDVTTRLRQISELRIGSEIDSSQNLPKPYQEAKLIIDQFHRDFPNTTESAFADLIFLDYLADLPEPNRINEMLSLRKKISSFGNLYFTFLANISIMRTYALQMTENGRNSAKEEAKQALSAIDLTKLKDSYAKVSAVDHVAFPDVGLDERRKTVDSAVTILKNLVLLYDGKLSHKHKDLTVPHQ